MHVASTRHPPASRARALGFSALALLTLALPLVACSPRPGPPPAALRSSFASSPCVDGSQRCAAADAAPGSRSLRRGHRISRYRWIPKVNRESGGADVGLDAEWEPTSQRR